MYTGFLVGNRGKENVEDPDTNMMNLREVRWGLDRSGLEYETGGGRL